MRGVIFIELKNRGKKGGGQNRKKEKGGKKGMQRREKKERINSTFVLSRFSLFLFLMLFSLFSIFTPLFQHYGGDGMVWDGGKKKESRKKGEKAG